MQISSHEAGKVEMVMHAVQVGKPRLGRRMSGTSHNTEITLGRREVPEMEQPFHRHHGSV